MVPPPIPDAPELTPRQAEIFNFLFEQVRRTGRQPTIRGIARTLGIRSSNGVTVHVRALQRKGWLGLSDGEWGLPLLRYPDGRPFEGFTVPSAQPVKPAKVR